MLQNTLSNFASGLMIMLYRPFDIGDVVDVAGVIGTVKSMTLVTTSIMTADNRSATYTLSVLLKPRPLRRRNGPSAERKPTKSM